MLIDNNEISLSKIDYRKEGVYWNNICFGKSKKNANRDIESFIKFIKSNSLSEFPLNFKEILYINSVEQFDRIFIDNLFEFSEKIIKKNINILKNNISSINYFLEPSLRTQLSFERAYHYISINYSNFPSVGNNAFYEKESIYIRNESEKDILQTLSTLFDIIISRHPSKYFPLFSLWVSEQINKNIFFINAGSGEFEHPTQSLVDLFTIYKELGNIDNKKICFFGDCKNVRSVRSLSKLMSVTNNPTLYFITPNNGKPNDDIISYLSGKGINNIYISNYKNTKKILKKIDVLYLTRYAGKNYSLSKNIAKFLKKDAIILHPLPKDGEISSKLEYEKNSQLKHLNQVKNSIYIRSAILISMLQLGYYYE